VDSPTAWSLGRNELAQPWRSILKQQKEGEGYLGDDQGDLFDSGGWPSTVPAAMAAAPVPPNPKMLNDAALVAAIPYAGQAACVALAAEVVERSLLAAVPALEDLCRRFHGFGRLHPVREQAIALETLVALGGAQANAAVSRLIYDRIIEGPGLQTAFKAAVALKTRLPADIVSAALDDVEPAMRALACRCARFWPKTVPRLIELLDDLHANVAGAAAMTLGEMGRREAMPHLKRLVQTTPSAETVEALVEIADDDCFVLLGRIVETQTDLRQMVCQALDGIDHPRAVAVRHRLAQR
jgi:HEAT repeats